MRSAMMKESDTKSRKWFALYTKPRNEFKAEEQINALGIEFYLPTITRLKQWSDRKKKVTEPVLRGYIFIYADERERLAALEEQAIVRCVFDMGRPAVIPEWQIENLRLMLDHDSEFFVHDGILPGVKVLIEEGPFQGVQGVVVDGEQGKSIAVSIDLLNRSVITHLPKDSSFRVVKEK